jgi:hypothetical protein
MDAARDAMDVDFGDARLINELLFHFSNHNTGDFAYWIPQSERFKDLPPNQEVEEEVCLVEDVEDDFYGTGNSASSATEESQTEVSPEPLIQPPILRRCFLPIIKTNIWSEPAATRIQDSLLRTVMDEQGAVNASIVAKANCEYCQLVACCSFLV